MTFSCAICELMVLRGFNIMRPLIPVTPRKIKAMSGAHVIRWVGVGNIVVYIYLITMLLSFPSIREELFCPLKQKWIDPLSSRGL